MSVLRNWIDSQFSFCLLFNSSSYLILWCHIYEWNLSRDNFTYIRGFCSLRCLVSSNHILHFYLFSQFHLLRFSMIFRVVHFFFCSGHSNKLLSLYICLVMIYIHDCTIYFNSTYSIFVFHSHSFFDLVNGNNLCSLDSATPSHKVHFWYWYFVF